MKEEHQVREQIDNAYNELNQLRKASYMPGSWRRLRAYIDALEWVLEQ